MHNLENILRSNHTAKHEKNQKIGIFYPCDYLHKSRNILPNPNGKGQSKRVLRSMYREKCMVLKTINHEGEKS